MLLIKKGGQILIEDGPVELSRRTCNSANVRVAKRFVENYREHVVIDSGQLKTISSEYYRMEGVEHELPTPEDQIDLVPLDNSKYEKLHLEPQYQFRDPFVAVVPDVSIAGINSLAYTKHGGIIGDTIDFDVHNDLFTVDRTKRCLVQDIGQSPFTVYPLLFGWREPKGYFHESRAAILHGQSHTFYQWMIYHLLKIRGVEHYESQTGNSVHLIVPPDPPSYIEESLDLLGYSDGEYTEWDREPKKVDELIVPSFPEPSKGALLWLRNRILAQVDPSTTGPEWIYISRQQADRRRVANFSEVKEVLDDRGIEIVEFGKLTLAEQVNLVYSADGIIGPHGAGLTNMIWGDDLTIVELFGQVVDAPFFIISDILDHKYEALSGRQASTDEINRDANIIVDIEEFSRVLDSVM